MLLMLVPIPLTLAFNSARVATLVALGNHMGVEILETPIHPLTGWVSFAASSLGMFALADYGPRKDHQ
jgi:exosortase/archaeosortase family protein